MRLSTRTILDLFLLTSNSLLPSEHRPLPFRYSEQPSLWMSIRFTPKSVPPSLPIRSSPITSLNLLAVGQWIQMVSYDSTPGSMFRISTTFDSAYSSTNMITRSPVTSDKTGLWISLDATTFGLNSVALLSPTSNPVPLVCAQSHRDIVPTDSSNNFRSPSVRGTPYPWTSSRNSPAHQDSIQS